ncbi:MAG TPA: response regulator transcription factor, partial [Candidatus Limnocylindrales bacterium]|nr:response regulator transcription factor [Candidatus Limnocylindrales bacterium]
RDDPLEALRVARDGWKRVLETEDWLQAAVAASTTLEACSAAVEHARGHRDFAGVADATGLAREVLPEAERRVAASEVPARLGARREAELHLGMARGHMARIRGRRDPRTWARLAEAWNAAPVPYLAAKCRWWQAADALHLREKRGGARDALLEAWRIASALPARPLLRELERLARRARIALPGEPVAVMEDRARPAAAGGPAAGVPGAGMLAVGLRAAGVPSAAAGSRSTAAFADPGEEGYQEVATDGVPVFDPDLLPGRAAPSRSPEETLAAIVGAGAGAGAVGGEAPISPAAIVDHVLQQHAAAVADPFGLSPRESEVLAILAEGRTNREIAERLFISDRTVAVHVRNILAKLGVSGRVEATSVAIRLGLVPGFSDGPAARLSR